MFHYSDLYIFFKSPQQANYLSKTKLGYDHAQEFHITLLFFGGGGGGGPPRLCKDSDPPAFKVLKAYSLIKYKLNINIFIFFLADYLHLQFLYKKKFKYIFILCFIGGFADSQYYIILLLFSSLGISSNKTKVSVFSKLQGVEFLEPILHPGFGPAVKLTRNNIYIYKRKALFHSSITADFTVFLSLVNIFQNYLKSKC